MYMSLKCEPMMHRIVSVCVFGDLGKVQGSGPLLCIDVGRKG